MSEEKRRLAEVGLLEGVTRGDLLGMKVRKLDRQIDTLREIVGRDHVRAKRMIGNKRDNVILGGLEHLGNSWMKESYSIGMETGTGFHKGLETDYALETESHSEDPDVFTDDPVVV